MSETNTRISSQAENSVQVRDPDEPRQTALKNAMRALDLARTAFMGATSVYLNTKAALQYDTRLPEDLREALEEALEEAEYDAEIRAYEYKNAVRGEREQASAEVEAELRDS